MADGLPASQLSEYPPMMKLGYRYHHWIDDFTDSHESFRKSRSLLFPSQGHYSAVVVDLAYDHFLALNWAVYSDVSLEDFANHFYKQYLEYNGKLPDQFRTLMTFMIRYNWLQSYRTVDGLQRAFYGLSRRTKNFNRLEEAVAVIYENKMELEIHFKALFRDIIPESKRWIQRHIGLSSGRN